MLMKVLQQQVEGREGRDARAIKKGQALARDMGDLSMVTRWV